MKNARPRAWLIGLACIAAIVGSVFLGRTLMELYGPKDTVYRELRGQLEASPELGPAAAPSPSPR